MKRLEEGGLLDRLIGMARFVLFINLVFFSCVNLDFWFVVSFRICVLTFII